MNEIDEIIPFGPAGGTLVIFTNGSVATSRKDSVMNLSAHNHWPDLHDYLDIVRAIRPCAVMPRCTVIAYTNQSKLSEGFHSGNIEDMRPSELALIPSLRGNYNNE